MAHIPMDDIKQLWKETKQHDWSSLHKTLQQHKGKVNGISDTLIDMLLPVTERFAKSNEPYPSSPQELYEVLNRHLPKERHA